MQTRNFTTRFKKTLIAATVAVAGATTIAAAVPAVAGMHRGGPVIEQLRALELSDAQRGEIRSILMAQRGELKGEREALRERVLAFARLDPNAAQYSDSIDRMADEAAAKARELSASMLDVQAQIRAVLTEEQRSQVIEQVRSADIDERLRMHGGGPLLGMMETLELSDDQWLALRHIKQAHQEANADERTEAQAQLLRFVSLDPASADYAEDSAALVEDFVQSSRQRVLTAAELQRQVYAVLTPEQRDTLVAEIEDFKPRHMHREMRGRREG